MHQHELWHRLLVKLKSHNHMYCHLKLVIGCPPDQSLHKVCLPGAETPNRCQERLHLCREGEVRAARLENIFWKLLLRSPPEWPGSGESIESRSSRSCAPACCSRFTRIRDSSQSSSPTCKHMPSCQRHVMPCHNHIMPRQHKRIHVSTT